MRERRKYPRYDILAQIRVRRGRVNHIMAVKDISLSGLFISADSAQELAAFRVDQEIEMDIFTPEALENVRVMGRIVRVSDRQESGELGFGVEFTEIDETNLREIARLVDIAARASISPPPLPSGS